MKIFTQGLSGAYFVGSKRYNVVWHYLIGVIFSMKQPVSLQYFFETNEAINEYIDVSITFLTLMNIT